MSGSAGGGGAPGSQGAIRSALDANACSRTDGAGQRYLCGPVLSFRASLILGRGSRVRESWTAFPSGWRKGQGLAANLGRKNIRGGASDPRGRATLEPRERPGESGVEPTLILLLSTAGSVTNPSQTGPKTPGPPLPEWKPSSVCSSPAPTTPSSKPPTGPLTTDTLFLPRLGQSREQGISPHVCRRTGQKSDQGG